MENSYVSEELVGKLLEGHDAHIIIANNLCRNYHTAQDLVQEAYIRVLRTIKDDRNIHGLMKVAIRHAWLDMKKKQDRRPLGYEADFETEEVLEFGRPPIQTAADDSELSDELHHALAELPELNRVPFLRYAMDETPLEQVAMIHGIGYGAARSRMLRARDQMRRELIRENPDQYRPYVEMNST